VDIGIDLLRGHGQEGKDERRCARSDFRGNPPLQRITGDKAACDENSVNSQIGPRRHAEAESVRGLAHFEIVLAKNDFRKV
jgi:hypothetical protein